VSEPRGMSRARTVGSFGATTVLSGAVSLLTIPLIVLLTNSEAWGSVALGQAVGSSVGVLAMFGWGVTGPAVIAMMAPEKHAAAYWDSIVARGILFVPGVIATVIITWLVVPTEQLASTMCAVAMVGGGLSGSWYAVGKKRPDRLFLLDTIPRIAGTLAGVLMLWVNGSLVAFGLLQLAGSLVAFVLMTLWALPGLRRPADAARGFRGIGRVIAEQRHGVAVAVAIAAFYPIVLAIVAALAPRYLPLYALIEKVLRFATMAMQPVFQFFQATVPAERGLALTRAIRRSLLVVTVLAAVFWAGFSILLPIASNILTAGQILVPTLVAVNLGAYVAGIVFMTFLSSVALIAVGRVETVGPSALIGSAIGLVVILVLALIGSSEQLSWGFVATAVLVLGYQFIILFRALPHAHTLEDEVLDPETVA
jgi:hypothetical protein